MKKNNKRNIKLLSFPGPNDPNPYIGLFYDALSAHGIDLAGELIFDFEWFKKNIDLFDGIHLHWPESLWRFYSPPLLKTLRNSNIRGAWRLSEILGKIFFVYFNKKKRQWFKKNIDYIKNQNKKIIWTCHNIKPHEDFNALDSSGIQILADCADLIIFHSEWAENQFRKRYKIRSATVVMYHGNYQGVYPCPREKSVVMHELGFSPDKPIVGFLGNIREYKGLDIACKAMASLSDSVQFLCAGSPFHSYDLDGLKHDISMIENAVLVPRRISDQEFSDYANLCEFLLLPYWEITGSGALLACLTLGKGVVASDLTFFRDMLSKSPEAGFLFETGNPKALGWSIRKYLEIPAEVRSRAALDLSNKYKWSEVVFPAAKMIQNIFI
jgi:glycosyltransferase involved in cell wall biosynthesis